MPARSDGTTSSASRGKDGELERSQAIPYRPLKSQEVLRQSPSQTPSRPNRPKAQSGTHNKKPCVVRGSERLQTPLSRLEVLILVGQKRLFN